MKTHPTFIERYSLPIFLILTPLISLSLPLFVPLPPETLPLLIALIPALMGIILAVLTGGGKGAGALLKKLFQWRVGLKWYLIALSMALVLRLTMSLLALLLGWIPVIQLAAWGPAQYLLIGVFTFVGAIVEELGWRGYVLPKLLVHRSALASALIIGIPWGILHLSLIFPGQMNAGTSWLATVLFLVALSIILTWFFIQTRNGIVVGLVYHATQNFFVFFNGGMTSAESLLLMTAVTAAIAIILILIYGQNLQRSPLKEAVIANTT
jgi:membrane protease YdiL (CAAX protease family)